jgi:putative FmdB family regulatory protein
MPTYDYRCNACGHEFELFQSMTEGPKKKCPDCSKLALERLIGLGAGVIFKGSGFYETDYRSDSYRKGAEAEKKAAKPDSPCACGKKTAGECATSKKPAKNAD